MTIGNIDLGPHPVMLAPMEDVTDIGFRLLCKRFGASMVYTEFVSAEALVRDVKSTVAKLNISDEERAKLHESEAAVRKTTAILKDLNVL